MRIVAMVRRVLMPVRCYLTGMNVGAVLGDAIELLGGASTSKVPIK